MKRLKLSLLAAAASAVLAAPAAAQMDHSNMPGMKMPPTKKPPAKKAPAKKAAAKKPGAKKAAPAKPAAKKAPVRKTPTKKAGSPAKGADPHSGHDMSAMPAQSPSTDPHAGHAMPATPPATTMPRGHDMSQMPGVPMPPAHQMLTTTGPAGTDLPAGNAPAPPFPTDAAADRVFGRQPMDMGRHHLQEFHGGQKFTQVMWNIAEYQFRNGRDGFEWDGEGWYGGDINRLWIKSEGEVAIGKGIERAEVQALYSRAIDPYWNLQGGVRYDFKPNPSRIYATIGVEGLAPSFFDVEGALFLSNKGELMARAQGFYDQRITQRLILQPRAELNFAAQSSREIGVGAGLSSGEVGLRLRYDIRREFAPYVGVQYSRAFGDTRRFLRDEGEKAGNWSLLTGIRLWF